MKTYEKILNFHWVNWIQNCLARIFVYFLCLSLRVGFFLCFPLLQEYTFVSDSAHLDEILNRGQWEDLHHPKVLPHIPLVTIGTTSAESSVLQNRFHVHFSCVLEEDDGSFITGKILTPLLTCALISPVPLCLWALLESCNWNKARKNCELN